MFPTVITSGNVFATVPTVITSGNVFATVITSANMFPTVISYAKNNRMEFLNSNVYFLHFNF